LFAARGIAVFTYDQRGFGLTALDTKGNKSATSSYGKTSWADQMQDIAWAIRHAKDTFGSVPLFLMGHSMACLILDLLYSSLITLFSGRCRGSWFCLSNTRCRVAQLPLRCHCNKPPASPNTSGTQIPA
jgi:predicted alpha/beta hydrolase